MNVLKKVQSWLRWPFKQLKHVWSWLRWPAPHRTVVVDELPDQFRDREIYLIGENGHFWCVAMLCPCGCSEIIQLNLVAGTRPLWTFELDSDTQAITLSPSIWRTVGCRSHFHMRLGRVQWSPPTEDLPPNQPDTQPNRQMIQRHHKTTSEPPSR